MIVICYVIVINFVDKKGVACGTVQLWWRYCSKQIFWWN